MRHPLKNQDEEPECQYPKITEACKPSCKPAFAAYEACKERIKTKPGYDCEQWYFDYMKCIDKCRVPQIFKHLK